MKAVLGIAAAAVLLAGCAGMRAERAFDEAHQSCSIKFPGDTVGYQGCMQFKAMQFQEGEESRRQASAGLRALGQQMMYQGAYPQQPARAFTTTQCRQMGAFWNCNSF